MPQASVKITTNLATVAVTPVTGDALLIALAAQFRAADEASDRSLEISRTYPNETNFDTHDARSEILRNSMSAVQADGLIGVVIQVELLHCLNNLDSEIDAKMRETSLWSITNALSKLIGCVPGEFLGHLKPHDDLLRTDDAAFAPVRAALAQKRKASWKPAIADAAA